MKIEQSFVKTIKITDISEPEYRLDPVTIYLEDVRPGAGKITIEVFGKSWSSFWGSMGSTVSEFVCRCDSDYIIKNLSNIESTVADTDALIALAKVKIKEDDLDVMEYELDALHDGIEVNPDLLGRVFGEFWYHEDFPTMANHHYTYLERIVKCVKEALKSLKVEEAA